MAYDWLPPLMRRQDYASEQEYYDALHDVFQRDFIDSKQSYEGLPINIKRLPPYDGLFQGKAATFRHLITEGKDETDRTIVPARCERIGWMLPVLERAGTQDVRVWENRRRSGAAYIFALPDFSYKLVLAQRKDYLLLWTHFPLQYGQERLALRSEYERLRTS